uniref:Uncharacterized protein n=1 Tax=Panagrolaimus davidi TaxID=227884 RepID=A0A914PP97_9BILA
MKKSVPHTGQLSTTTLINFLRWWQLLLYVFIGILFSLTLICVIYCTIRQARKSGSSFDAAAGANSEMPTSILIHPPSRKMCYINNKKSSSMKVKLIGKRDLRSTVQDQHYPISNKKRSHWEHSLDYSNPYNPKRRFSESDYSM